MTAPTTERHSAVVAVRTARGGGGARLTAREREVVALAREGTTSEDIGRRLGISTRTARALLREAGRKLAPTEPREPRVRRWLHGHRRPPGSAGPPTGI